MNLFWKLFLGIMVMFPVWVGAQGAGSVPYTFSSIDGYRASEAFRYYKIVSPQISVPTVVEVSLDQGYLSLPVFSVYDVTYKSFEPHLLVVDKSETQSFISTNSPNSNPSFLNDGDYVSFVEFPLTGNSGQAQINFNFEKSITASSLRFALDENVALPEKISVSALVGGRDTVVLAPIKPAQNGVVFPKTSSTSWKIVFDYVQPLRITEMQFNDLSGGQIVTRNLRFLAQPGHVYQIYFDADKNVKSPYKESGDLVSDVGVIRIGSSISAANPEYRPSDLDEDKIPDLSDNCSTIYNPTQEDGDRNGRGDACEDYDRDGVLDGKDNCPQIPNFAQTNTDADEIGDICDSLDNRATERMPWLPWLGIGIAGLVLLVLFVLVLKHKPEEKI
ncbi:MAG: thrombospondin type 3 repeat-containing protein [Minisyncoccia bacterium]